MAERKPNGGSGGVSTSSSGTNLLFSSSATEFSFNVPFIPVTQASASPASLLLPGGNKGRAVPCVVGSGRGTYCDKGQTEDIPFASSYPLDSLPGSLVTRFEWVGGFGILEAAGDATCSSLQKPTVPSCPECWTFIRTLAFHKSLLNTHRCYARCWQGMQVNSGPLLGYSSLSPTRRLLGYGKIPPRMDCAPLLGYGTLSPTRRLL